MSKEKTVPLKKYNDVVHKYNDLMKKTKSIAEENKKLKKELNEIKDELNFYKHEFENNNFDNIEDVIKTDDIINFDMLGY